MSFSQDKKWLEAKRAVGVENSWVEIVSYYRAIDGKNVFVYTVGDGDKRLIVDFFDDENVLLISRSGEPIIDTYDNVTNSRKLFRYSENFENREYSVKGKTFIIPIEK